MLVRLMYASRPAPALDAEELAAILRESRAANPQHGITGVLCVGDGVFVQVLEGSRSAVNRLYQLIAADARHKQLELLSYEEITERRYAAWAMGQMDIARLNPALLLKYSLTAHLDPFSVSGAATAALLDELTATASIVRSP
ncbi:MAG: BLUF domain-containing protein [Burkholderiales bacterium]|nr:BLUF domain-containing protein [Burkholderiales bacterium]